MSKYRDTLLGSAVIVGAVILFIATFGIKEFSQSALGAGFVPRICAVVFAVLGAVLIVRETRRNRAAPPEQSQPATAPVPVEGLTGAFPVVLNILLFGLYLYFLERIGFIILSPVYMFLQILLLTNPGKLNARTVGWYALLSVVVCVSAYYLFVNVFMVMLPNGILS